MGELQSLGVRAQDAALEGTRSSAASKYGACRSAGVFGSVCVCQGQHGGTSGAACAAIVDS